MMAGTIPIPCGALAQASRMALRLSNSPRKNTARRPACGFLRGAGTIRRKKERLKYGRDQGLETNEGGFALSGPRYYSRFLEVTLSFIRDYGINQLKIDG